MPTILPARPRSSSGGSARTPYRLLAGILGATALLSLLLAAFPGNSASLRGPDVVAAVVLAGLAAIACGLLPGFPTAGDSTDCC